MIQIIGWIGCLYLFVKGCELAGLPEQNIPTKVGAGTAIVGSLLFVILLQMQSNAMPSSPFGG